MRSLHALALITILSLAATALLTIPSCIEHMLQHPADWQEINGVTRREAERTIKKMRERHGTKPVEEWPEGDQQIWRNAKRILGESVDAP